MDCDAPERLCPFWASSVYCETVSHEGATREERAVQHREAAFGPVTPPWDMPRSQEWLQRYPPPYRLACDLAVLPLVVSASLASHWVGAPLLRLMGYTPLFLVVARYHYAAYGPQQQRLLPVPGRQDLYREVACVLISALSPAPLYVFPHLWVDTAEPAPMELGWSYGFPKVEGSVTLERRPGSLRIAAEGARGPVLAVLCREGPPLPAWLVALLARGEGLFPTRSLRAGMGLERVSAARLLWVESMVTPGLDSWGVGGRSAVGLWLEGAILRLDAPRPLGG